MKKKVFIILSVFWICFIFFNSSLSTESSSNVSGRVVAWVQPILNFFKIDMETAQISHYIRKAAHVFEFFVLTLLAVPIFFDFKYKYLIVLGYGVLIASIDETIQAFRERGSSIKDVGIDTIGICLAILICFLYEIVVIRNKKNKS